MEDFTITAEIAKADDALRVVWGWASVAVEKGVPVIDKQNHIVEIDGLQKAAHNFVAEFRTGSNTHKSLGVGTVVESMVFTKEVQKSLGIDLGREGWYIGMKIHDDALWQRVKKGEMKGFSIGGTAVLEDAA